MGSVDEYKYVGVMIDREGDWRTHVRSLRTKVKKKSREMMGWLGRHEEVSPRVKLEVWEMMVGAKLRYGSEVWFAMKKEEMELEAEQMWWARHVMRLRGGTDNAFVRGEGGLMELRRARDKMPRSLRQ